MMEEGADWFEEGWWARRDSNPGPRDYESPALTAELRARLGNYPMLLDSWDHPFEGPGRA